MQLLQGSYFCQFWSILCLLYPALASSGYGTADATYPTPENFVPGSQATSNTLNAILGSSNTDFANPNGSDDKFMPSIGLQFEATADLSAYATYSKGFKAGGYSGGSTGGRTFRDSGAVSLLIGAETSASMPKSRQEKWF